MHILESKELHASNNQIDLHMINRKKQNCAIFNFNKLRQYQGCKSSALFQFVCNYDFRCESIYNLFVMFS